MSGERLRFYDFKPKVADFRREVLDGLLRPEKSLPPKFFYDRRGSELFEAICETEDYYPTRTESGILRDCAGKIAETVEKNAVLIEPGSGNSRKVRLLLELLAPAVYMPLDIAREPLFAAARALAGDYPWLEVHAACLDYTEEFELPRMGMRARRVVFFPGSTIGNFEPDEAGVFLRRVARLVAPGGGVLIGVDLKKEPAILNRAYNDGRGITRKFNLNLLRRINDELEADFDLNHFRHRAFYNECRGRIEMHLVSDGDQEVRVAGERIVFADGESIHTENSYKYSVDEFRSLACAAGFTPVACWCDRDQLFSVHYFSLAD